MKAIASEIVVDHDEAGIMKEAKEHAERLLAPRRRLNFEISILDKCSPCSNAVTIFA
ncbi:hypothetical protein ACU8KG_28415 (plasmid) [Rhizobium leguminosarum]